MATLAREEVNGQENNPRSGCQGQQMERKTTAREARLRRCLKLRQGASPLRPRPPFPEQLILQNGVNRSRVRKPRRSGAPLTDRFRSETKTWDKGKGALWTRAQAPATQEGRDGALRAHEALPHPPPGGKPPETPDDFT